MLFVFTLLQPSQKFMTEDDLWFKIVKNNALISLSTLIQHFEKIQLIPHKLEASVVRPFALILVRIQSSTYENNAIVAKPTEGSRLDNLDEQNKVLSFAEFVQILGFMSAHIDSYSHRYMPHFAAENNAKRNSGGYHVGWHVIMQTASEYFFHNAMNKWLVYEFDSNKYVSNAVPSTPSQLVVGSGMNGTGVGKSLGLSPSSILWLCRQGNLILSLFDMCTLFLYIEKDVVKNAKGQDYLTNAAIVPTSKLPSLLASLASHHLLRLSNATVDLMKPTNPEEYNSIIYQTDDESLQYTQALIGSSDLSSEASIVAKSAPALFFASPQPLPSLLQALYSPSGVACLNVLKPGIKRILNEIRVQSEESKLNEEENMVFQAETLSGISLSKVINLCHKSNVVPVFVTDEVILKMASYIFGREVDCDDVKSNKVGSLLTEREFIDLLFACSQVIFGGLTETFSPSSDCIILKRKLIHETNIKKNNSNAGWEWVTSAVNDERLKNIELLSTIKSPHIAIADRVDRLYCLCELIDPAADHIPLIERLNVNNASEKMKKMPFIIGQNKDTQLLRIKSSTYHEELRNENDQKTPSHLRLLGKLLEFLFTESGVWMKIHAISSKMSDSSTTSEIGGSFFNSILILCFLLFPISVNSFSLTPWDIAGMLRTSALNRNDPEYENDSKEGFPNLIMDLRFICAKHDIVLEDFERFLSYLLLEPISNQSSQSNSTTLSYKLSNSKLQTFFPYLIDLFSPANLQRMEEGFPLLLWGFLSCCRGCSGHTASQQWYIYDMAHRTDINYEVFDLKKKIPHKYNFSSVNPFLEDVTAMFPTRESFLETKERGKITLDAVKSWALLHDIDCDICEACFQLCTVVTESYDLHFSNFLIFGILCFYRQQNDHNLSPPRDVKYLSTGHAISELLESLSCSVHRHQQISTRKALVSIIIGSSSITMSQVEEIVHLSAELFRQLYAIGKHRCLKKGLTDMGLMQQLPPRPPQKLWDVARFIGYCKAVGIISYVGSIVRMWEAFGMGLSVTYPVASLQSWSETVVAPLPIQITVDKVCELLSFFSDRGISTRNGKSAENLFNVIKVVVAPYLSGFIDDLISTALLEHRKEQKADNEFLDSFPDFDSILRVMESRSLDSQEKDNIRFRIIGIDDSSLLLEDIMRYGGDRTMASLRVLTPWIMDTYKSLRTSFAGTDEPLTLSVTQYLSSSKLLSLPTFSMIIKQSMSNRKRDMYHHGIGSVTSVDTGISMSEFEEILLRCAFAVWCNVGGLNLSKAKSNDSVKRVIGELFESMTSIYLFLTPEIVGKYCEECRCSLVQYQQKQASTSENYGQASAFHANFHSRTENVRCYRSWGIDFFTPFCCLLNETATFLSKSAAAVPPTPDQVVVEPPRSKALPVEVPSITEIVDFQKKDDSNKQNSVSNMLESWGSDSAALTESKIFDATKGVPEIVQKAVDIPQQQNMKVEMDNLFSVNGNKIEVSTVPGIDGGKGEEKLLSPRLPPAGTTSPPSIVSRSEEMLAHILAMRNATPSVEPLTNTDQNEESPSRNFNDVVQHATVLQQKQDQPPKVLSPSQSHDLQSEGIHMPSSRTGATLLINTSPFSPTPYTFPPSASPSPIAANNDKLLEGTKEALWPVFATYCSCGDSSEPGKLSGPNLFALLSKLDLLTDETMISDLGVLLHQISAHSLSQTPSILGSSASHGSVVEAEQSPLLSFEEFIVFLCAFAQLRFEGVVKLPSWSVSPSKQNKDASKKEDNWFAVCNSTYMSRSKSFKRLLEECVLPPLKKKLLLASPEDARHRDECSLIFSLETLFSIESVEKGMMGLFKADKRNIQRYMDSSKEQHSVEDPIVAALARIKIIPQIVSEHEVMQLIADILPSVNSNKTLNTSSMWAEMKFPQWQWVICVIAFKAVTFSIQKGQAEGKIKV